MLLYRPFGRHPKRGAFLEFSRPGSLYRFISGVVRRGTLAASCWLKGTDNGIMKEPPVRYYVMGDVNDPKAPGNEWRTAHAC